MPLPCDSGVSAEAVKLADSTAYIPMSGFVSSFNVSVAAALVFYEARRARLERLGHHCDLSEHEKQILTAVMLLRHQVSVCYRLSRRVGDNHLLWCMDSECVSHWSARSVCGIWVYMGSLSLCRFCLPDTSYTHLKSAVSMGGFTQ